MTRSSDPTDPTNPAALDAGARLRAQYQRGCDALADEEAPSPAVRAAVLAAAARQVQARPQPVGARPRWRVPLAAAASVLVGTLAVVLATRHDDSTTKTVMTSEATAQPTPQSAAAPASPTVASPPVPSAAAAAQDTARAAVAQAPVASPAAPPPVAASPTPPAVAAPPAPPAVTAFPAAPPAESSTASANGGIAAEARAERRAQRDMQAATAPAPGSVVPSERSKTEAAVSAPAAPSPSMQGSTTMSSERTNDPGAGSAASSAARQPRAAVSPAAPAAPAVAPSAEQQVKARPVQRTAPMADAPPPAALSTEEANRWIYRIVELRRTGRDAEADAELKALRERAPTLALPPEALPRLGGR